VGIRKDDGWSDRQRLRLPVPIAHGMKTKIENGQEENGQEIDQCGDWYHPPILGRIPLRFQMARSKFDHQLIKARIRYSKSTFSQPMWPLFYYVHIQAHGESSMKQNESRYIIEFNRVIYDDIRRAAWIFQKKWGIAAQVVTHKTTLVVIRPKQMSWSKFKGIILQMIQPRRGSALIFSERTGASYICSNRGNRPGQFQLI